MQDYSHIVVDAHNLAHRVWWRNRYSVTSTGRDNSIEGGFCSAMADLRQRFPNVELVLAWDGEPQRQKAENADYKAHRQSRHDQRPADWHQRLGRLRESLGALYSTLYDATDEADVEIARFVRQAAQGRVLIVSTDRDLLMLLNEQVDVLRPGQAPDLYHLVDFEKEYSFVPARYLLYKALVGDRSDNLPGVGHFPSRQAMNLAAAFDSINDLYDALHRNAAMPVLARLTKKQRAKLLAAKDRVRSNGRVMDLLADNRPIHHFPASKNEVSFRELLEELELLPLAVALLDNPPAGAGVPQNGTAVPSEKAINHVGSRLPLLPGGADRLAERQQQRQRQAAPQRSLPLATTYFGDRITLVDEATGAQRLVDFAKQRALAFIGIDFEFCYTRPGVPVKKDHTWNDPRSIQPLLMGLALVEPHQDGAAQLYRFAVDVRHPERLGPVADLFKVPLPFIAHFGQVELFRLWQLG